MSQTITSTLYNHRHAHTYIYMFAFVVINTFVVLRSLHFFYNIYIFVIFNKRNAAAALQILNSSSQETGLPS